MRENLIGYLLNAVDPDERATIEEQLKQDASLRREMELLRAGLQPLSCDADHHAPPAGLAQRCCQFVFSRTEVMPSALSPVATPEYSSRRRWSWLDVSVAGAIAAAVGFLLVPAIYQSHLYSQQIQCQDNLQHVGAALANYSERHDGYYPASTPQQPLSATTLVRQGYVPDSAVVCPSNSQADDESSPIALPEKLQSLQWEQLDKMLSHWNSYGYTLGFRDGKKVLMQRNLHRNNFALASDLPGKGPADRPANSPNHGGNGQNVLFEDGHVKYLNTSKTEGVGDDIFRNAEGEVAPGVDKNDAVIVPSEEPTN